MKLGPTPVIMVIGAVTAHYPVRRTSALEHRWTEPTVWHFDCGRGGDLRRVRGARDLFGPAERRESRARYGFHRDRRHGAEHDRDDRLSGDHRTFSISITLRSGCSSAAQFTTWPRWSAPVSASPKETGTVATFTKLLRVAMLLPVVVTLFVFVSTPTTPPKPAGNCPASSLVFAVLVVINSLGRDSCAGACAVKDVSRWCLVTAIAALGMKTRSRRWPTWAGERSF